MSDTVTLFELVKASPTHSIGKVIEWEDRGRLGRKTKQYLLTLRLLNKQEALRLFPTQTFWSEENYVIGFRGDLPVSIREQFTPEELTRGYSDPGFFAEGFLRRIDDLFGIYGAWLDSNGWQPL